MLHIVFAIVLYNDMHQSISFSEGIKVEPNDDSKDLRPYGPEEDRNDQLAPISQDLEPVDFEQPEEINFDEFRQSKRKEKQQNKKTRRIILCVMLVTIVLLAGIGVLYYRTLTVNPSSLFNSPEPTDLPVVETPTATPVEITPTPEVTLDPYEALQQQADLSMMNNIVNIMLIGVDYAEERETWSGKNGLTAAHADVMIVLAVNFNNNTASLISLPRDTYTKVPGVSGIYKLNASLDCGGGLTAANGAGFRKVCQAASNVLGGLPVNYYYAVTMPAVKQLVDSIGGVDYDLEISFKMQGRSYKKGYQHMDGQAVLDYLRVRKTASGLSSGDSGDANRVNRQKKMLVQIFQKIKDNGMMTSIPDLLSSFQGQLYTNCSVSQTAALALYGYNMPASNISMYSMSGTMKTLYTWNFCFTDMNNRANIIKRVYNVDVSPILDCTEDYATYLYQSTYADQYLDTTTALISYIQPLIEADDMLPVYPVRSTGTLGQGSVILTAIHSRQSGEKLFSILNDENEGGSIDPVEPQADPPTDPPTEPTDPPTEPTDPPTEPTDPPTEPTDPPAIPTTQPTAEPTAEPTAQPTAQPTPIPTAEPSPSPEPTPSPSPDPSMYQQYTAEQRQLYMDFMTTYSDLYNLLKKSRSYATSYLNGGDSLNLESYTEQLSDLCDLLQQTAEDCAITFGYPGTFEWEIVPLAETNEIYVDFR